MTRSCNELNVGLRNDGRVWISQTSEFSGMPSDIILTPDQIDLVISWLEDAKKELEGK